MKSALGPRLWRTRASERQLEVNWKTDDEKKNIPTIPVSSLSAETIQKSK